MQSTADDAHRLSVGRDRLRRRGLRSWYVVGLAAAAIMFAGLAAISALVVPLIASTVVAMLFAPTWRHRRTTSDARQNEVAMYWVSQNS